MEKLSFLLCLLLALCNQSLSADDHVLVSIDCGSSSSSAPYRDENGIVWTGDDEYVKSGESRSVQLPFNSSSEAHVMSTLRVFNNNKTKNCYTIGSVKPGRVLVRATFYYGNYDGKNSPPEFDLLFDGYYWGTVDTSGPLPTRNEVTYVTTKDSISVCVALTISGLFPIISALEVRSLESSMYSGVDDRFPLFVRRRLAFGSNATIRFPDDPYDRLWTRDLYLPNGTSQVSSDTVVSSELTDDNPPPAVLKTAIASTNPNSTINLFLAVPLVDFSLPYYLNLYFSETTRLKPNETRSFNVFKDNAPLSTSISAPYANCTEINFSNISVWSNTTFSLVPTNGSTLPPLINAMEVFRIGFYPLEVGTHKKDVEGLAALQEAFSVLEDWTGDPCLPEAYYAWNWIKCNYDETVPRVTTLSLGGYGLSGLLPDFSSMDALQTISLPNNSLRGNIPDFLGTFPNLQILVSGNPGLSCASNISCSAQAPKANSSSSKKKKILEILFAAIIPSIILLQLG